MFARFYRRSGFAVLLSALSSLAAAAPTVQNSVLQRDDACITDNGHCALSALQARSVTAQRGRLPSADDGWVWPEDVAVRQMGGTEFTENEYHDTYEEMSPIVNEQCMHYNAYFWPQVSFWAQEIVRRVEAFPADSSPAEQSKLQHFARDAAYLSCVWYFDPRKGNGNWSDPVAKHMQTVMDLPSSSLEMPELPSYFHTLEGPQRWKLFAVDACMMWMQAMSCDVGYIARDMKGSKSTGDKLCWDEVDLPPFSFSLFGTSFMPERGQLNASKADEFDRSEYLRCQEHPLTKESMSFCPMGGHWPDGMWNQSSWGASPEPGSQRREEVLSCNKKLGNPDFASITPMLIHIADEGEDVDVMHPYRGYVLNMTQMTNLMNTLYNTPRDVLQHAKEMVVDQMKQRVIQVAVASAAKQAVQGAFGL